MTDLAMSFAAPLFERPRGSAALSRKAVATAAGLPGGMAHELRGEGVEDGIATQEGTPASTILQGLPTAAQRSEHVSVSVSDRELDQRLVERVQQGDKQAFGLLVSKYQRKLIRLLSRWIRDPAEVEDVAQETFIKAYRALPGFRGESAFYTWLYRIGINAAKNWLAQRGRRVPTTTEFDSEEAETFDAGEQLRDLNTPEHMLVSKQIAATVNGAMEALPEDLRNAIMLREIEGMSYEEIAVAMDCPIGTVRSRIFRAREAIAARLRPLLDAAPDRRW